MTSLRTLLLAAALALPTAAPAQNPKPHADFSFFITSVGSGKGGNLGGLAGADAHCQKLAAAVGADKRNWRAYLSTQAVHGGPVVNARDRIGKGPWYNVKGDMIAQNLSHLHGDTLEEARAGNRITFRTALNELGKEVNGHNTGPDLMLPGEKNNHDILTGTRWDGTAYTDNADHTCKNWTSEGEGSVQVGHYNRPQWNSIHAAKSCKLEEMLKETTGALFYCFAAD
ncbi:MAG: lectin [Alphaproteobacteria bacterium]|nr:lectin [Alphaproteobacteria bacterium]